MELGNLIALAVLIVGIVAITLFSHKGPRITFRALPSVHVKYGVLSRIILGVGLIALFYLVFIAGQEKIYWPQLIFKLGVFTLLGFAIFYNRKHRKS